MQINIKNCLFVLDSEKNSNIRKNDIKSIKVLVDGNLHIPSLTYECNNLKQQVRDSISKIIGSNIFHLEQVYTMDYKDSVDIIYLGITNKENVTKLKKDYKLIDFYVENNNIITYGDNTYTYKTVEKVGNNNIEYIHEIDVKDKELERDLLSLLISYKRIRSNIDNTDIIFKFMGNVFTLEDVRTVYELVKDCKVDKSNFRKKIIKYCEKTGTIDNNKNGFRPSQKFKFKPLKGDLWI